MAPTEVLLKKTGGELNTLLQGFHVPPIYSFSESIEVLLKKTGGELNTLLQVFHVPPTEAHHPSTHTNGKCCCSFFCRNI